ncbi:MAG: DUF1588 domain-containing protein [Deltaproteobacteria bacterium]|nr:DUF1588 domain-containing protein [Deltaproteobacteria bacterium]
MPVARITHLAIIAALAGCQGYLREPPGATPTSPLTHLGDASLNGDATPDTPPPRRPLTRCASRTTEPMPLLRLTREQYVNTVRDLFRDPGLLAPTFAPDDAISGFHVGASTSALHVEQQLNAAESIAERAATRLQMYVSCAPATGDEACAARFVTDFGLRAYRRPLTAEERENLLVVYRAIRAMGEDFSSAMRSVIEALLASPQFLYHTEHTADRVVVVDGLLKLRGFGIASRLSYHLLNTMPDDAMLAQAGRGELESDTQIDAATRTMLDDVRARRGLASFATQWLDLDRVAQLQRDPALITGWSTDSGERLHRSIHGFIERAFFGSNPTLDYLYTSGDVLLDGPLARIYGVPGVRGDALQSIALEPGQRGGLITQPALLAMLSKSVISDPIHRGVFVLRKLLCQDLPPPPAVSQELSAPREGVSTRMRLEELAARPACTSCHTLINPIGVGLENFDSAGRWRSHESGVAVDPSGELLSIARDIRTFGSPVEMAQRIAASEEATRCVPLQLFRYTLGRNETESDACQVNELTEDYRAQGLSLRALLRLSTTTTAFRYVRPDAP